MFDPTKPVQLRDGRDAGIYDANAGSYFFPIHGWYDGGSDRGRCLNSWRKNGASRDGDVEMQMDLVNVPPAMPVIYCGKVLVCKSDGIRDLITSVNKTIGEVRIRDGWLDMDQLRKYYTYTNGEEIK